MRLPWEQLAMEVIEVSAPELGTNLYPDLEPDLAEAAAGWGIVHLVKWALARCPEHLPPSASALIPGPTAAKQICRAARWRGAPLEYVRALIALPDPVIEQQPDGGIRMRGLDRYDAAWGDRHPKEWAEWRAAHPEKYPAKSGRKSAGNPPEPSPTPGGDPTYSRPSTSDPDPDPDADVETQKAESEQDSHHHRDAKSDDDDGNFLWGSIAFRRKEHDLAAELHKPKQWRDFIQRARADGFNDKQLQRSHAAFLLDHDFRLAGWPTAVWITDKVWRHRVGIPPPKPARDPLTGVRVAR